MCVGELQRFPQLSAEQIQRYRLGFTLLPQHDQPFHSKPKTCQESVFPAFWTARAP